MVMSLKVFEAKTNLLAANCPPWSNSESVTWVDIWSNELVVRQSPADKKVSTEVEDIVGMRHQATTGEDIANWQDFMCAVVTVIFGVCNSDCRSYL
jgi:hypothetical protein